MQGIVIRNSFCTHSDRWDVFGHATSQKVVCEPKDVQIIFLTAITTVINQILGSGSFNFNSDCSCISGSIALILDQPKTVFEEGKYAKKVV